MKKATSYQRRGGKLSTQRKKQLQENAYLLRENALDQIEILQKNFSGCVLELGFGMGDHLIDNAHKSPNQLWIGIDLYKPGIGKVLQDIAVNGLKNCYLIEGDATDYIDKIHANSIDRIDIHHPDPWPKKRHHKRRILSAQFIECALRTLKNSGFIHIITDDEPYFLDILETFNILQLVNCRISIEKDRQPNSKYGIKAQRENRVIHGIVVSKS